VTRRPHNRPPWWPDDEPWFTPPWDDRRRTGGRQRAPEEEGAGSNPADAWRGGSGQGWERWRSRRHGDVRRGFGCLIALLSTLVVSIGVLILWLLAGLLGVASMEGPLAYLARPAGLIVLVVGIVALIVGIRIARGVGRPLTELVDAAGRIEAADYTVRVSDDRGRGDLRRLGNAFNAMAARLESEDATRRRLLADVSHELRTPLAVVQGNLEALLDGVYPPDEAHIRPILEETAVLERLIDDLRTLSLAESGALPLHREPTDPAVLLEDVAAAHRARASSARIDLIVEAPSGLPPADIDPVRMHQVISNLVDNAIRAMTSGGTIRLSAGRASDGLVIEVSDDGPGIPGDIREHVFERFTKSATSRGSGLGLAIAQAIVEAHGGTISATAGPAGRGTMMQVRLPA
jgi:two-component system sensor histidine kinase BaeS